MKKTPPEQQSLETDIEHYAALSAGLLAKKQAPRPAAKWLGYTAAASSVMAMSASVDASIIYSGLQNISLPGGNANTFAIDLNNDIEDDFIFSIFSSNTNGGYTYAAVNGGNNDNGIALNGKGLFVDKLGFGDIVGSGGQVFIGNGNKDIILRSVNSGGVNPLADWGATSTGFMGAKLNVGNDSYFAWIRIALTEGNGAAPKPPADIIILDWAYENSGAAIIAGLTSGAASGGQLRYQHGNSFEVRIPTGKAKGLLKRLPANSIARLPYPHTTTSVTGAGVAFVGGSDMHTLGFDGIGIKIGIIDLGFGGLAGAQASGDLPATGSGLNILDYTGTGTGGSDHGTNVAEITTKWYLAPY